MYELFFDKISRQLWFIILLKMVINLILITSKLFEHKTCMKLNSVISIN